MWTEMIWSIKTSVRSGQWDVSLYDHAAAPLNIFENLQVTFMKKQYIVIQHRIIFWMIINQIPVSLWSWNVPNPLSVPSNIVVFVLKCCKLIDRAKYVLILAVLGSALELWNTQVSIASQESVFCLSTKNYFTIGQCVPRMNICLRILIT